MSVDVRDWLGWAIFALVGILIVGFSLWFVRYYKLRHEPAGVTGVIGFLALLFAILSLFLVPVDIYMVKKYRTPESGNAQSQRNNSYQNEMQYAYYTFYSIFMFFLFIGLPFGYFYYEELGDIEDKSITFAQKACASLKYTAVTAFLWATLIVIGLFVDLSSGSDSGDSAWTSQVSNRFSSKTDRIMPFCYAILTCIGMFFSMCYTSWGLAAFPITLMKKLPPNYHSKNKNKKQDVKMQLRHISEELDILYTKYRGKDEWRTRDRVKKNKLERDKKTLQKREVVSPRQSESGVSCADKCGSLLWSVAAPFRYLIGISLLTFSMMLIVSLTIHLIDQVVNSSCGYSCGWALADPKLDDYNPTSWILTQSAKVFPIDYILFTALVFWLFWCTIFGLMMIDVRFLCFKLFSLAPHQTMHNALLMAIGIIILCIASFNYLLLELATHYMTFGRQPSNCSVDADSNHACPATEIFYFLSGILVGMPVFGLVYFIMSWVFILLFLVSVVYNLVKKPVDKERLLDQNDDLEAMFKD